MPTPLPFYIIAFVWIFATILVLPYNQNRNSIQPQSNIPQWVIVNQEYEKYDYEKKEESYFERIQIKQEQEIMKTPKYQENVDRFLSWEVECMSDIISWPIYILLTAFSWEKFWYSPHDWGSTIWWHDGKWNIVTMDSKWSMACMTTWCDRTWYWLDPRDKNTIFVECVVPVDYYIWLDMEPVDRKNPEYIRDIMQPFTY